MKEKKIKYACIIILLLFIFINFSTVTSLKENKIIIERNEFENNYYSSLLIQYYLKALTNINFNKLNSNIENDTLDQKQTDNCGLGIPIYNETWFAQSFTPFLGILTRVELFLYKEGTPSDNIEITVSIRESLYRSDLISHKIYGNQITKQGNWIEFNFSYIGVVPGRSYNIVCKTNGGSESDHFCWYFNINNPYIYGDTKYSENYGYTWSLLNYPLGYPEKDFCFKTYGVTNFAPNKPIKPDGVTTGYYGVPYNYSTIATDIDDNELFYLWDWGDGTLSEWLGPYNSGETCIAMHTWMIKGSYLIKVKTKDTWEIESEWSDLLTIRMEKSKIIDSFSKTKIGLFSITSLFDK